MSNIAHSPVSRSRPDTYSPPSTLALLAALLLLSPRIAQASITNWAAAAETVNPVGNNYHATVLATNGSRFFRLGHP